MLRILICIMNRQYTMHVPVPVHGYAHIYLNALIKKRVEKKKMIAIHSHFTISLLISIGSMCVYSFPVHF